MRSCAIADPFEPTGDCDGSTNMECFSCGQPACGSCTRVVPYFRYGNKRLCTDCIAEWLRLKRIS